jgi:hypothetical protein
LVGGGSMGSNVDVGINAYEFSLKRNWQVTIYVWWPQDIGANQWFRLAPAFGADNGWDCILQILNEGISIDNDGTPMAYMTVENLTPKQTFKNRVEFFGVVDVVMNVVSAPSNF